MPRAAGRGRPDDPRQQQPGHDHDRPAGRGRRLSRAAHPRGRRGGDRQGASGRPARRARRPDGAQPRDGPGRARDAERYDIKLLGTPLVAIEMAEDRERFRDLLDRIGQPYAPSAIVEGATADRAHRLRRHGPRRHRPAGDREAGLHPRRDRWRHRRDRSRLSRARPRRSPRQPDRPGDGREVPRRLAGDRIRGHARRGRHLHRGLLDGERRPPRRPHRRLDRCRAGPDAAGSGPPAAAERGARDHPGARGRGRLQRPVRALAGLDRIRRHRGQPAGVPVIRARLEGDRLSDCPGRGADRGRQAVGRDPECRHGNDRCRVRAGPRLRRREAAALPVRQVPDGRSDARQPDEGDRRSDGDRSDVRRGPE